MNTLKILSVGVVFCVALVACGKSQKQEVPKEENVSISIKENSPEVATKNSQSAQSGFYGSYEGTLPCADCEGIKTKLTIRNDGTYDLRSEYLGKKDGVFEESGTYYIINQELIELNAPSSGQKTYYKILTNGTLALSNAEGKVNDGELAAYYILKKK